MTAPVIHFAPPKRRLRVVGREGPDVGDRVTCKRTAKAGTVLSRIAAPVTGQPDRVLVQFVPERAWRTLDGVEAAP